MLSYKVRLRDKTFVWGGEGLLANLQVGAQQPLFLTMRVDDAGVRVDFGRVVRNAGALTVENYGNLEAGQSFTVPLNGCAGVFAAPVGKHSTFVMCSLHGVNE